MAYASLIAAARLDTTQLGPDVNNARNIFTRFKQDTAGDAAGIFEAQGSAAATKFAKGLRSGSKAMSNLLYFGGESLGPFAKIPMMLYSGKVAYDAFAASSSKAGMALGLFGVAALGVGTAISLLVNESKRYQAVLDEMDKGSARTREVLENLKNPYTPEIAASHGTQVAEENLKKLTEEKKTKEEELAKIREELTSFMGQGDPASQQKYQQKLREKQLIEETIALEEKQLAASRKGDREKYIFGPAQAALEEFKKSTRDLDLDPMQQKIADLRDRLGKSWLAGGVSDDPSERRKYEALLGELEAQRGIYEAAKLEREERQKSLEAVKQTAQANERALATLKGIQNANALIGLSGGALSAAKAAQEMSANDRAGVSVETTRAIYKAREVENSRNVSAQREKDAESVREANRTPYERFKDDLVRMQNLRKTGFLGEEDFNKGAERLVKGLDLSNIRSSMRRQDFSQGSNWISTDYYRSINVKDEQKALMKQQIDKLGEQIPILKSILDKLGI